MCINSTCFNFDFPIDISKFLSLICSKFCCCANSNVTEPDEIKHDNSIKSEDSVKSVDLIILRHCLHKIEKELEEVKKIIL